MIYAIYEDAQTVFMTAVLLMWKLV